MFSTEKYFLTEAVFLQSQGMSQHGVLLNMDFPGFQYEGDYSTRTHHTWIEQRRREYVTQRMFTWEPESGFDSIFLGYTKLVLPQNINELICEFFNSPSETPFNELNIDEEKSRRIYSQIQLPIISWLHKKELIRIKSRINALQQNNNNPVGKTLWEHANLCLEVIDGWFIRNNLEVTDFYIEGERGHKTQKFLALMEEALSCGQQTANQLWEWKARFADFEKGDYFEKYIARYEKEHGKFPQGGGSGNGLEWRTNEAYKLKPGPKAKTN